MAHTLRIAKLLLVLFLLLSPCLAAAANAPTISISVDATDAPRKMIHAQLRIPVSPGKLTLYYPKWLPGEHGPTGPVQDLTGLMFTAGNQRLKWRRDLLDAWTFHVEIPAGVNEVTVSLDYASPATREPGYSSGISATEKLYVLSWNTLLLYPAGWTTDQLTYTAKLKLPAGWKFATSLPVASQAGSEVSFAATSLTMLVDGPVQMGEHLKVVPLSTENPPAELDVAADSAAALDAPPEVWDHYKNLVTQAGLLFGAPHYRDYHFLLTLSDHVAHFGLEHHESNDSRTDERALIEADLGKQSAGLLPHEYVHSWNGKYRRPADLTTPDFEKPMQDDLLWVYEGLTTYLGEVLTARSGALSIEEARDALARTAADLDHRSGRAWRDLQDTADGVPAMQIAASAWSDWRRPLDYYPEDILTWLWADVIIRQKTNGQKSLDDFCKLFHGGQTGPPTVKTYTFDDVVNTLNQVVPYDWRTFWTDRLASHGPGAPLAGLEDSGWRLMYDETPSDMSRTAQRESKSIDAHYSVGLLLKSDGTVRDTVENMAGAKAGIGPGMTIVAVNGRKFTSESWHDAIRAAKGSSDPIELIVENSEYFRTIKLDYHQGDKYPHLMRDESRPDLLTEILKAK
jgi:predicted metalloprotease with PDZ domain